jgi:hypothetical protein
LGPRTSRREERGTSPGFAVRADGESNVVVFTLALGITATLVVLERAAMWMMVRMRR